MLVIVSSCATRDINSKNEIVDFVINIESYNSMYNLVTITGKSMDSALWIKDYKITYIKKTVIVYIQQTLIPTNNSSLFYISFLVPIDTETIKMGKNEIIWTKEK
jgi:hypothetical protein